MGRKKKTQPLKHFTEFIEGDEELRTLIFKASPAPQQIIFELFSQLEHLYYSFFSYFCALPSTRFWDLLLLQLSAVASGTSKNRNFSENSTLMEEVDEDESNYKVGKAKSGNLMGAAHALWFAVTEYGATGKVPKTHDVWRALWDLNPSRTVWEWWLEARAKEAKDLWSTWGSKLMTDPYAEVVFEEWAEKELGLLLPRSHWFQTLRLLIETYDEAVAIKHRISRPYLRLVYTVTKQIAASNQAWQFFDTFNYGCSGLMKAIAKYAPSMSLSFPTFAEREIRYEIYYQLSNYNLVALPYQSWQKYRELEAFKKEFHKQNGRDVRSLQELAEAFDIPIAEVLEIYSQIALQNPQSLEKRLYSNDDVGQVTTLKDRVEDPQEKEIRRLGEEQEVLLQTLEKMPLKERKIFTMLYNLTDLVQDIRPDAEELNKFFEHIPHIHDNIIH